MSIQATEYNSLYFNQIRVLCTGSAQREICWANVRIDRPQQPRWLVVAQIIVLFMPLFIVDLLQMLWIQFDAWKRGILLAPPLSVSPEDMQKISDLQHPWPDKPSPVALQHTWGEILRSKGIPLAPPFSASSEDIRKISGSQQALQKEPLVAALQRASREIIKAGRTKTVVQCVEKNAGIVFSFLEALEGFQISGSMNRDMEVARHDTREHNEREKQIQQAIRVGRTQNVVEHVGTRAGIVFSYLDSVEGFEISPHMSWDIEVARRETWRHNGVWEKIQREMQREENTQVLVKGVSADAAAIVLSYLDEEELGELGNFPVSAPMRNQIQNAKDDAWFHNLASRTGYIYCGDFAKLASFAKRSDFGRHISRLSRKTYLHVCSPSRKEADLNRDGFLAGFSHLTHINTLVLNLQNDLLDDILAQALRTLGFQLEKFECTSWTPVPKIVEALKYHCSHVKHLTLSGFSSSSIADCLPHLRKMEHLTLWVSRGPIQQELLEVIGNHLSFLRKLHLSSSAPHATADFPIEEWQKVLTNNQSLQDLSLNIPFSPAILNAVHTSGSNLQKFALWVTPGKSDLLFNYFKEAPMSTCLQHLTELVFYFENEPEMSLTAFQQIITSFMNRYPKLETLSLFDLPVVELDKVPSLLRPKLGVAFMSSTSTKYMNITSTGVTHR